MNFWRSEGRIMTYLLVFILLHPLLAVLYLMWADVRAKWLAAPTLAISCVLNFTTAWALWGKPRRGEWTISQRLKRPQRRNQALADALVRWLNKHDPGHVS